MGDIHTLPTGRDAAARLFERIVVETIEACPDQRVAERWAQLARETTSQFFGPPSPSQPEMDLGLSGLDEESRRCVHDAAAAWMESYFNDVRGSMMAMHRELLSAQKRIAELEVALHDRDR